MWLQYNIPSPKAANAAKGKMSEDRVNKCPRAVVKYVEEALQPLNTADCPWFR